MRMDADTRNFFEPLMTENPPMGQTHLRKLIENQLTILRALNVRSS